MATTIKPLEDRVLVQPLEAEQTTASGLVIPDTAKEKPQEGKVISAGPGRVDDKGTRVPMDVKEGDVVIFSKYGGTEVKYDGQEYLLLNARDILAVVEKRGADTWLLSNFSLTRRPVAPSSAVSTLSPTPSR